MKYQTLHGIIMSISTLNSIVSTLKGIISTLNSIVGTLTGIISTLNSRS